MEEDGAGHRRPGPRRPPARRTDAGLWALRLPEAFSGDGSGRLADVVAGDWEVVCYVAYYHGMPEQVRIGLRDANLSEDYAKGVPEFYLSDNRSALLLLKAHEVPVQHALGNRL